MGLEGWEALGLGLLGWEGIQAGLVESTGLGLLVGRGTEVLDPGGVLLCGDLQYADMLQIGSSSTLI